MKVQIWGCIESWKRGEEVYPYEIPDSRFGVESIKVILDLDPLKTKRVLRITLVSKDQRGDEVSPVWLTFEDLDEALKLLQFLVEGIRAYSKDENLQVGFTPNTLILV